MEWGVIMPTIPNVRIKARQGLAHCIEANTGKTDCFVGSVGCWMCEGPNVTKEERTEIDKLVQELIEDTCQHRIVKRDKEYPKFVRCFRCGRVLVRQEGVEPSTPLGERDFKSRV